MILDGSLVSFRTFHMTCAHRSVVNFSLLSLTATVSIVSNSLKTWICSGHRSPNTVQSSAEKVQSISLRAYRFPGVFLGSGIFICIASAFVLVTCDYFDASSFLNSSSNDQAPHGRTMRGVMPFYVLSNIATYPPGATWDLSYQPMPN